MSAIAGMIDWQGGPAGPAVRRAIDALATHGRDGEALWVSGFGAALGWRQTILLPEDHADHQPLSGCGGQVHLVFDGRIDNRQELAHSLSIPAGVALAQPDSAYVLAAFEKWGADCVAKLLGDFAFAIWDGRTRVLLLARDHMGHKPLYFHRSGRFILFASQPSALFTDSRVPREIDERSFLLYLATVQLEPGESVYRGIERVPAGTALLLREDGVIQLRHWRPESIPLLRYKRDDDYTEAFLSILNDAVECRLRSIHPIGSHLSSGWDSSTITVTAARLLQKRNAGLTSFTAVPPARWDSGPVRKGVITDEGDLAAAVAMLHPNIEHVLVHGGERLDLDSVDRRTDAFEMPQRAVCNIGWMENLHGDARSRTEPRDSRRTHGISRQSKHQL